MKLRTRITTVLLLCGLVPLIVAGFISYRTASSSLTTVQTESSNAIRAKVISGLDAQRDLKEAQLTAYFDPGLFMRSFFECCEVTRIAWSVAIAAASVQAPPFPQGACRVVMSVRIESKKEISEISVSQDQR